MGYKRSVWERNPFLIYSRLKSLLKPHYKFKYICCDKDLSYTKAVEASAIVLSVMYFSQHMNQGKCFAHFEFNVKCLVQNI